MARLSIFEKNVWILEGQGPYTSLRKFANSRSRISRPEDNLLAWFVLLRSNVSDTQLYT